MTKHKPGKIRGGMFLEISQDGMRPVTPRRHVDAWLCRRVWDFTAVLPPGAGIAPCEKCGEPVVYDGNSPVTGPKVCFQCGGIVPLPMTGGSR